jgi:hypothetical protein
MELSLYNLLRMYGYDPGIMIAKVIRHRSWEYDLDELVRRGQFDLYQWSQAHHIYNCDQVISFLGVGAHYAKLVGIYDVLRHHEGIRPWPEGYMYPEMGTPTHWYDVKKHSKPADLEHRLVIDWGASPRSWHQWLTDRPVVEIRPPGFHSVFPGYMDFVLSFTELRQIMDYPDANQSWHQKLSAVGGVYLITDDASGRQYVGSATGKDGLLGRWRSYAKEGHGGNALLRQLVSSDPEARNSLHFTILCTVSHSISQKEVIEMECLFKRKLGSRVEGLNQN